MDPTTLTPTEKTRFWRLLRRHVIGFSGSAGLGSKQYQHLGFTIGYPRRGKKSRQAARFAWSRVYKYAKTDAKSLRHADLFDAIVNTFTVRTGFGYAVHPEAKRTYVELWSAHSIKFEDSHAQRVQLLAFLSKLGTPPKAA